LISIFTPTYNRANTIHRVWESLLNQTNQSFEWIIVDDGSKDNIEEIVKKYQQEANFPILFKRLERNRGKHVAINRGVEMASGELFIIADSDDVFKSGTVDFFVTEWNTIPVLERQSFSSIRVCCEDQFGNRISDYLPKSPFDASMAEIFYKYNFRRESWSADRVDLLKENPFPEEHVGYFPEGIIWKQISRDRKIRFFNEVFRVYYIEEDSIMRNNKSYKSKINRNLVSALDILNNDIQYFGDAPLLFIKKGVIFCFYALVDNSFLKQFSKVSFIGKLMLVCVFPVSYLIYVKEVLLSKK